MKLNALEKKKLTYVVAAVIFVLLAGSIYFCSGNVRRSDIAVIKDSGNEDIQTEMETMMPQAESVVVHVTGAVGAPGVYEIASGMRVVDAIEAAGGFLDNASDADLNLAQLLTDGEKITVLTKKQAKRQKKSEDSGSISEDGGLVNINTASKEELMTLPGIGEAKADAIIEYRDNNGGFKSTDELMEISGIKEGVYSKIAQYITV